jgi:hypothetical protein
MIKTLFVTKLTDVKSTDIEGVGTLRYEPEGKIYRWVKNRNTTAFTAKQPVCYDADNAGSSILIQKVNTPVTADLMLQAGIAVSAIAASGGNCYGWVQVQGYFQDARVKEPKTAAFAIGDELAAVNATTYLNQVTAVGTAPKYRLTFQLLEAIATNATSTTVGSYDVYIACI